MLTVAEIMIREPYTLTRNDSLLDARNLMAEHHIRHIPIVDSTGCLVGLVSQRDILAAADSSLFASRAEDNSKEVYVSLSSVMSTPVRTAEPHDGLRGTAMRLQKNKLGCLPVVEEGKLVGIITDSDFVSIAVNLMEQLEVAEPDEYDDDDEAS